MLSWLLSQLRAKNQKNRAALLHILFWASEYTQIRFWKKKITAFELQFEKLIDFALEQKTSSILIINFNTGSEFCEFLFF